MSDAGTGLIDLAAARVGGRAVRANDEFFARKERLLAPGRGVFVEGRYTSRGKWMDGWETRRRRTPGHDWCVIRLGIPGVIRAVTVDTNHFRGNHPEACSLDARVGSRWVEILPRSPLEGHTANEFPIASGARVTLVRLNIYPDGGVARLRVWGEARPDWPRLARRRIDLAAIGHGTVPIAASDEFFGEPLHLILPGRPANMGDGWETRRRRGPGHDWVILRLGHRGRVDQVEVDTTHFKGNFPESASLEGCDGDPARTPWAELVPRMPLRGHTRHRVPTGRRAAPVTHVRLNVYPDGGVARLRLWGRVVRG